MRHILTEFDMWQETRTRRAAWALKVMDMPEKIILANMAELNGAVICQIARMAIEDPNPISWQDALRWVHQPENKAWLRVKMDEARLKWEELRHGKTDGATSGEGSGGTSDDASEPGDKGQPVRVGPDGLPVGSKKHSSRKGDRAEAVAEERASSDSQVNQGK